MQLISLIVVDHPATRAAAASPWTVKLCRAPWQLLPLMGLLRQLGWLGDPKSGQPSGSTQVALRQRSGSAQAALRQRSGSPQAVLRQRSGSAQAVLSCTRFIYEPTQGSVPEAKGFHKPDVRSSTTC